MNYNSKHLTNSPEGRDIASIIHPLTNLKSHLEKGPVIIDSGEGVWVTDIYGNKYIEGMSGLWCVSLGYGQERLVNAAANQMRKMPYYHLTNHKSHNPIINLAETLLNMAPVPMSKVWFANSGSEGNDSAARIVWYYWSATGKPQKRKIISHRQAYHGNTIASASLSGMYYNHASFGLPLEGFLHTTPPHHYRFAKPEEGEEEFATRLAGELETLIEKEGSDTIGAFFTEPIMGSGGVIVPPPTYYEKIQKILTKHDILLIADEVITGFGRTGNMFGTTTMGLNPDMIVCAKGLSSAYIPISALFVNDKIFEAISNESDRVGVFGLSFTYSGHPVSAAVASEALKIYEEEEIVEHVKRVTPVFQEGLRDLIDHPLVGEVRGVGLLAGVEFVKNKINHEPFSNELGVGAFCNQRAEEHGLIVRAIGDTISFCPPLIIDINEVEEMISRFRLALDDTWKQFKNISEH
ncbi:MAG: aspartate aminotransferase family protein [Alphaproteobacteria bacterium]|jgi:4-aminobutyrate--pyruvate transaminase|nr:aspartate aminotransferase family protein [Alphaproteobacteria bacterium]PPR13620.1 MAG: putative aminotransferase [Alphaproteobacteria bacterium MarineAlpha12_Bin1]|tara:strand:+ start:3306 stop:4700 length:1395 start_codon:yes stop_codon:yes gene_type:complete